MNTFFYATRNSEDAEGFAEKLLACETLSDMTILPAGQRLCGRQSLSLRNGDVMILFAQTEADLATLIRERDIFLEFRIILILGTDMQEKADGHTLRPRYISEVENTVINIEKIISKMQSHESQ